MTDDNGKHRRRQRRTVREIDNMQHAVDQRQSERNQRINGPSHEAVREHR